MSNQEKEDLKKVTKTTSSWIKELGIPGAFIAVFLYLGQNYMIKFQQVQKDIQSLKIQIVKLQNQIIPANDLLNQMDQKIQIHEKIWHNNSQTSK